MARTLSRLIRYERSVHTDNANQILHEHIQHPEDDTTLAALSDHLQELGHPAGEILQRAITPGVGIPGDDYDQHILGLANGADSLPTHPNSDYPVFLGSKLPHLAIKYYHLPHGHFWQVETGGYTKGHLESLRSWLVPTTPEEVTNYANFLKSDPHASFGGAYEQRVADGFLHKLNGTPTPDEYYERRLQAAGLGHLLREHEPRNLSDELGTPPRGYFSRLRFGRAPSEEILQIHNSGEGNDISDPRHMEDAVLADYLGDHSDPREELVRQDLQHRTKGDWRQFWVDMHNAAAKRLGMSMWNAPKYTQIKEHNLGDGTRLETYPIYDPGSRYENPRYVGHEVNWIMPHTTYTGYLTPEEHQHLLTEMGIAHDPNTKYQRFSRLRFAKPGSGQTFQVQIKGVPYALTKNAEGYGVIPMDNAISRVSRNYQVYCDENGNPRKCTCPDQFYRGGVCKHMKAVADLHQPQEQQGEEKEDTKQRPQQQQRMSRVGVVRKYGALEDLQSDEHLPHLFRSISPSAWRGHHSDMTPRVVAADRLDELGRHDEANLLRDTKKHAYLEADGSVNSAHDLRDWLDGIERRGGDYRSGLNYPDLRQYIDTALWSTSHQLTPDEAESNGGVAGDTINLDDRYDPRDIHTGTLAAMIADMHHFRAMNSHAYENSNGDEAQLGHDFWLSRNGHGAGFFDRPEVWGDHTDELQKAAQHHGEYDLHVGDDGMIHGSYEVPPNPSKTERMSRRRFAAYRAPAGGMVVRGTAYKGGAMIPDMEGEFMNPVKKESPKPQLSFDPAKLAKVKSRLKVIKMPPALSMADGTSAPASPPKVRKLLSRKGFQKKYSEADRSTVEQILNHVRENPEDGKARLAAADALEENNRVGEANLLRSKHPIKINLPSGHINDTTVTGGYEHTAWPGGYPMAYYPRDGGVVLCADCANDYAETDATQEPLHGEPYYEGPTMHCDSCNREIESAYGDPENPEGPRGPEDNYEHPRLSRRAVIRENSLDNVTH